MLKSYHLLFQQLDDSFDAVVIFIMILK